MPACLRLPARLLVLAALLVLGAGGAAPARAATVHNRFDFETPGYGGTRRALTDHFLLEVGGTWHLFYTELTGPATGVCRIGHATSTDLAHWAERPTVIAAGGGSWWANGVWAPHVVANPAGGWLLLFAGKSATGGEAIGGLASTDLDTWTFVSPLPLWTPPAWAKAAPGTTFSCRDPSVWFEHGMYSMLYTVDTLDGKPAIGRANSPDLLTWSDAGPFLVDSVSVARIDLESPCLVFDNGRVELLYSRYWTRILTANTSAGPWDIADEVTLDASAVAPEKVRSGAVQLLSRVRYDVCDPPTGVIVIDTVTVAPDGYVLPGPPGLPPGWQAAGDAFPGPAYGDGPKRRGDTPASPDGLRWMASGESCRLPGDQSAPCGSAARDGQLGTLRSPRFTLLGDSLWFRVMGAASPDSAHVRLLDACTGVELARRTGPGTSALTRAAWSNAGRRGWPVQLDVVDRLTRPGGVIGLDTVVDSTIGTFTPPTSLAINQTQPVGGENLTPGTTYTIRWASFSNAGVDSHVVYVSYDNFATPPIRLQRRNANQFSWGWSVPAGPQFDVRIRVVAYAKNGVHDCDTSAPFSIAVTTGAGDPGLPRGLALSARGNPGPTPTFDWSAPPGTRVGLRLYDVRGRLVRALVEGAAGDASGTGRSRWDGRDSQGRLAPPGVFFAVLTAEGGERRRLTVIRLAP